MEKWLEEGYKELLKFADEAYAFQNEDEYVLVGIKATSCMEKTKIIDKVLDKVYQYGNEFYLSVIITDRENFEKIKEKLGKQLIP
ncbi:MAG: hypothetical protein MPF33_08190 [Candidatus Aramenus sp.]|nr:hypothetical protein [Candidatus Aramenus sp.]